MFFPRLPFAADVLVEALLIALCILCQIQFQVGFGFSDPIPAHSDSVSVFLPSDLMLFPPPVCFLFMSGFCHELLIHLWWAPDTFA